MTAAGLEDAAARLPAEERWTDYFADCGSSGLWRWTSHGWQLLTSANPFDLSAGR